MGRSKTIEQQTKSNQQFNEYIKQMNTDMENHCQEIDNKISSMITTHYDQVYPDMATLMQAQYSRLDTSSEWSLNKINEIIGICSKALFGGGGDGKVQVETQSESVANALDAIKSRELYIANAAFDIIQGVVSSFSSTTSTSVETKYDAKPVAPGVTLFIGVANNTFSHSSFLKNEKIIQTMYIFKVCYSIKEGKTTTVLNDLEAYESQKQSFYAQLKKLNDVIATMDVTAEDYLEKLQRNTNIADILNARLTSINNMIKELSVNSRRAISKTDEMDQDRMRIVEEMKALCARHNLFY